MALHITKPRYDDDSNVCRLVYCNGEFIGRTYKIRARLGGSHTPVKTAYRFDPSGLPSRDSIVVARLKDLEDRLAKTRGEG